MANNLQFLDDPDDVPFINENITLYVGVNGSDDYGSGSVDQPFRTLGKAIDVLRNKVIGINNKVTIQIGEIISSRDGSAKKYFEEEPIEIDFESAKRLKIKGIKPTDHEVIAVSYYDKASDRDGFYCQVLVTNQDKIKIGDYLGIYDHLKMKKANPSYFWVRNNIKSSLTRMITTNNCYVEAIRADMILGVHEVVDIGPTIEHDGIHSSESSELFEANGLQVGTVTLHIKNDNYTHKRLNETPFWNSLGTKGGDPIYTYAAGAGNSPIEAKQNNVIPPVFYGADMLSNPQTLESNGFEQFYYNNPVQQIEIADIMIRGYQFGIKDLDKRIVDPRTGYVANDATLLWNDKTLNGNDRIIVAGVIASYFYKKMINDLKIDSDLPFYFGKSSDPFISTKSIVKAAKKVRDYLLTGANQLNGVPSWDEDNHPGYGYGPFESGVIRAPIGEDTTQIDTASYPSEYGNPNKFSWLLRYYNIYPPINGQLYQPTLIKRIKSWYNDNATRNGLQLDRWEKRGNKSPFFCGYITPQGWYKQVYMSGPSGSTGNVLPNSIKMIDDPNGYHRIFGGKYPKYVGNSYSSFKGVESNSSGAFSNERDAVKNMYFVEISNVLNENLGLTSAGASLGNTAAIRGSMGSVWYSGSVNSFAVNENGGDDSANLNVYGGFVFDRYSFGLAENTVIPSNDNIKSKFGFSAVRQTIEPLVSPQTINIRAKCFKSVLRFTNNGIKVAKKSKLGLIKDICLINFDLSKTDRRSYGLLAEEESVINATNIGVSSFSCGISARKQSLINLLCDLGDSNNQYHKDIFSAIDPGAIVTGNGIGIESSIKSHVNAQRTVSSGSKSANYVAIANSSMDCSNSISTASHKHGYVCDFNSYMKALNTFSEFNSGIGYCAVNNSLLICHRSRSLWNGYHGLMASDKSTVKCYEFIARSNDGDGILAKNKSTISAGANSSKWSNYRKEIMDSGYIVDPQTPDVNYGVYTMLPPHLFQITVVKPMDASINIPLPVVVNSINSNPTHGINVFYHECNSTICEFNSGSGFASETDSLIVADNTISRYNSKKYGEFFLYGWSGVKGSFPTDSFSPIERGF